MKAQNCVLISKHHPPQGGHYGQERKTAFMSKHYRREVVTEDDGLMSACEDGGGLLFIVPHRPRPAFLPAVFVSSSSPTSITFSLIENISPFSFFVADFLSVFG